MSRHRVVIAGAGFGGLAAARRLRRAEVEVHNHHLFQPLLYQVATAILSPGEIAPTYFGHDEWGRHLFPMKTLDQALALRSRILDAYEVAAKERVDARTVI